MMKNTIAKLLAEEDIFVVHKQMDTAYFDVKNRELGLPIWKENTIDPIEEELMVCHEIGHALWTPLDMLENAQLRNLDASVVNVLEDARIEQKVKDKYLGTVRIFNEGYKTLIKKDFFGTSTKKTLTDFNLIDRINLHFKNHVGVPFSETERVWVERTAKTQTPEDVLDLAEDLIKWMGENPDSMGNQEGAADVNPHGSSSDAENQFFDDLTDAVNEMLPDDLKLPQEEGGLQENTDAENTEENSEGSEGSKSDDAENVSDGNTSSGDVSEETTATEDKIGKSGDEKDVTEGGVEGEGASTTPNITATTAEKMNNALDNARDKTAQSNAYVKINDVDLKKVVVPYNKILEDNQKHYNVDTYFERTSEEVQELKNSSKKSVSYMVKEFEMKKSADAYARAAESKTGSLNMSKLHTYKFNEDLFKKVTTLPGATNHGLVMCLDWSGSMSDNLSATLTQLFNLIWFCRKTKIPFDVYAFSDVYGRYNETTKISDEENVGCFDLHKFAMLQFFSSKMTTEEENKMMHYLWMISNQWVRYRDWRVDGYPQRCLSMYNLGGTPLNESIIAMMKIVPKFKIENNLQKVHTVFLTDGAGNSLRGKREWMFDKNNGEHFLGYSGFSGQKVVITDPITNKTIVKDTCWGNLTASLLKLLKYRVPEMNIVGFFVAGSGRKGLVSGDTLRYIIKNDDYYAKEQEVKKAMKDLKKDNVFVAKSDGYDEYYILPGSKQLEVEDVQMSDDLVGASKAKLKSAFAKSTGSKISSRPLLNKFVSMVA